MTTPGQSGTESNGNEVIFSLSRFPELEPHNQMQFRVIHRTPLFLGW